MATPSSYKSVIHTLSIASRERERIRNQIFDFLVLNQSSRSCTRPAAASIPGGASVGPGGSPRHIPSFVNVRRAADHIRVDWQPTPIKSSNSVHNISSLGRSARGNNSSAHVICNRLDSMLPSKMTVFDINIDNLQEKQWRHPGADLSDFFNFGLDELKWKDYCGQMEQLCLDSMRIKIIIYESTGSEQNNDRGIPLELATATSSHDLLAENPFRRTDATKEKLLSEGMETAPELSPIPIGQAIQVDFGSGERLPSIYTRRPQTRDSEAIIEIVVDGTDASITSRLCDERARMCDERARMLQDQFNVSLNHVQAMSILISTFHLGKNPSAIDQRTFARYTERTAFGRPLTSGVAYAVRVLQSEREQFEKQQGWTIRSMDTLEQTPVHEDEYNAEALEPSPIKEEYAPVIFAQDTISHVISVDMLSGKEDRENVLRARELGKGVLTAPFRLLKSNRLGVILTFAVYKTDLPSNATSSERIQATDGYLGGVFDIESLVEKLLQQLASKQTILVNVYDTTNFSHPISMYGLNVSNDRLQHVSTLNFGDPFRKHEMRCRFKLKPPWPWFAMMISIGILVIALLLGHIINATVNRIAKVEDDYHEMMELKKRAEAADVAKSQFLATVSHEIRTPMNGVLGMLQMLMDTDLDVTQQDYVRTAQGSGRALVSLINELLDQAKIESGKLELETVQFDLREILDDVLSLFSGKSQEKGVELAVYISDKVPEMLIGDPGRFRQIITNLMGNSIKFTEKGHIFVTVRLVEEVIESIEVETESSSKNSLSGLPAANACKSWAGFRTFRQDRPPCPLSSLSSDLINVIVSVEDTGVGIPLEAQPRVFTPFMQVGPSISRIHGGTGIGLSISKCLVGLMNGEIGFASLPRIGSTFTFTAVFTNCCSNSSQLKDPQISNQCNSAISEFRGMTALVVDPREVRAKVSRYHIQRLGIQVEVALDLNQCFSSIGRENTVTDMVLIEQEVWDKDMGLSALFIDELRKFDRGLPPKLFILSNSISSARSSFASSGIYAPTVIMKPLRASMLAASLQRAMGVGNKGNRCNAELSGLDNLLHGRKILVVDDNNTNRIVAAGALKKYGAEVVCAHGGKEAISLLKPPHKFDACFMDIQMPEMDGFEATKRIRDMECNINGRIQHGEPSVEGYENVSDWHVPILAMTADVIQATHEECISCGMDGYVSKPFEAEQLYREVSRFFNTAPDQNS